MRDRVRVNVKMGCVQKISFKMGDKEIYISRICLYKIKITLHMKENGIYII